MGPTDTRIAADYRYVARKASRASIRGVGAKSAAGSIGAPRTGCRTPVSIASARWPQHVMGVPVAVSCPLQRRCARHDDVGGAGHSCRRCFDCRDTSVIDGVDTEQIEHHRAAADEGFGDHSPDTGTVAQFKHPGRW